MIWSKLKSYFSHGWKLFEYHLVCFYGRRLEIEMFCSYMYDQKNTFCQQNTQVGCMPRKFIIWKLLCKYYQMRKEYHLLKWGIKQTLVMFETICGQKSISWVSELTFRKVVLSLFNACRTKGFSYLIAAIKNKERFAALWTIRVPVDISSLRDRATRCWPTWSIFPTFHNWVFLPDNKLEPGPIHVIYYEVKKKLNCTALEYEYFKLKI